VSLPVSLAEGLNSLWGTLGDCVWVTVDGAMTAEGGSIVKLMDPEVPVPDLLDPVEDPSEGSGYGGGSV